MDNLKNLDNVETFWIIWNVSGWSEKFLDSLKNGLLTFLSQKQFMHTVLFAKMIYLLFFVAKTIKAIRLESFWPLKSANLKVLTFWASVILVHAPPATEDR